MLKFRIPGRGWQIALAAALVCFLVALALKPFAERAVQSRIEATAARHGMAARIRSVHVGLWPLLRLEGFDLELGHGLRLQADHVAVTWPGRLRVAVRSALLQGPGQLAASAPRTTWVVSGLVFGGDLRLALAQPQAGLVITKRAAPAGRAWILDASALDLGRLVDITRNAEPLLEGGIAEGRLNLLPGSGGLGFQVDMALRGVRLGGLAGTAAEAVRPGEPTDVTLRFNGAWQRQGGSLEVPDIRATVAGAAVSGSLALNGIGTEPAINLTLGVQQLDFAKLLATSGLEMPDSLGLPPGGGNELGVASIELAVRGIVTEPAALSVTQKISYRPPRAMPRGIARLRGDFVFNAAGANGPRAPLDVSAASPDFIALHDVPPLFVRTLLLAEDASFQGHRGIDLRELPGAILTNWTRGTAARGASTITQQLAKNLFLSRDKQLGRKLQELAITFLLESALGKERILEIYLNIIEWGPGLRGLRPAARAYFGREPGALTPAQMAFLVSIIPGPIKYQSSFADGSPGPGLQALIDGLLAKLRSVDAIGEEEYQRALREPIVIAGRGVKSGGE